MDYTISVSTDTRAAALQRALDVYNAGTGEGLSLDSFVQKLIDGQLDTLVSTYMVTKMNPLDWLKTRFTGEERAAIRQAAMTNGSVADLCAMTDKADMIHFDDPLTIYGVNLLEQAGLIGEGRAAQILSMF